MEPIKFLIPAQQVPSFVEDLTAWAAFTGSEPQLVQVGDAATTTNASSPINYAVAVDENFFVEYPNWRMFVEQ